MVTRTRANVATVERTVRFYRVISGTNPDGTPGTHDVGAALEQIEALPFSMEPGVPTRYMATTGGKGLFTVLHRRGSQTEFEVWHSARNNLPLEENGGKIQELPIDDSAGLADAMHAVFFPPNIVGIAIDGMDSRITKLGDYITQKAASPLAKVEIQPLIHKDIRERLDRMQEITILQFTIRASYVDIVESVDQNLGSAFRGIRSAWEEQQVLELVIRPARGSGRRARGVIVPALQELIGRADFVRNSTKCKVRGIPEGSARRLTLDVLSDKLVAKKDIPKAGNRSSAVDATAAYEAIREVYDDLAPDIAQAAGVELWAGYQDGGTGISSEQRLQLQLPLQ